MNTKATVTRVLVPENQRMAITHKLFGTWFPMRLVPFIYNVTERLTEDYHGGYWEFYTLSNGGFYMALTGDRHYHAICENHYEGDLTADALGITSCLYSYSNLSFAAPDAFADICFNHYPWLKD
jgi:hypothetical protein